MKYQYVTGKKGTSQDEVWVCSDCRKDNTDMILIGKWRLIDKSVDPKVNCGKCLSSKQASRGVPAGGFLRQLGKLN